MPTVRAGTEEEAANLALAHLRQPPISLLSEDNSRARAVNHFFAAARDDALSKEFWNFATAWQALSLSVVVHPSVLKKVYPLPQDCLVVRSVEGHTSDEWAVEAIAADPAGGSARVKCLITNADAPVVCYTRSETDVRLWDPQFLIGFSYDLATLAGPQLGLSIGRTKELVEEAKKRMIGAAQTDAKEKASSQVSRDTSWLRARRIGGREF